MTTVTANLYQVLIMDQTQCWGLYNSSLSSSQHSKVGIVIPTLQMMEWMIREVR